MHQTGGGVRTVKATWPAAYRITEFERPIAAASDHLHKWLLIGVATSALESGDGQPVGQLRLVVASPPRATDRSPVAIVNLLL